MSHSERKTPLPVVTPTDGADAMELEIKRCYLPLTVKTKCPKCGKDVEWDGTESYLSYPVVNEKFSFDFYCGRGCEHEWSEPAILRLSLEFTDEVTP